jgi:flagellar hook-associated protein 2
MRIGGLASGMDIDQLVNNLMKAERMPLDKLKQKMQVLQWQRDDFRSMNTLLLDFRNELTQMKMTSKYRARLSSSSDETKLSVTANGSASQSSYSISNVSQLASSESIINGSALSLNPSTSLYDQTSDTAGLWKTGVIETKSIAVAADGQKDFTINTTNFIPTEVGSWSVKVNGKGYKVVTSPADLKTGAVLVNQDGSFQFFDSVSKGSEIKVGFIANTKTETYKIGESPTTWQLSKGSINQIDSLIFKDGASEEVYSVTQNVSDSKWEIKNSAGTVVGNLDKTSGKISFNEAFPKNTVDPAKDLSLEITYNQKYTSFSIGTHTSTGEQHETFLVQGNESINSLSSRVNASKVGVSMFYDTYSKQLTLTRTETGDFNTDPTVNNGKEISFNGSLINDVLDFRNSSYSQEGTNAILQVNGLTTQRSSNTFQMDGVTFTIKQQFTEAVTVNVRNDGEKVFENIKEFVSKYNELIDKIQKKVNEERYRTYTPLTDDQREQLSEKQQDLWEEKAKSGLIRRDPLLTSVLSEMRTDFYTPVQNEQVSNIYNQLSTIGIKTTSNYLEGGKLEINETKLREAIEKDPTSVENLFRGEGTTEVQKGIINRLYDTATVAMDKLKKKAGNSFTTNSQFMIGLQLNDLDGRIDRFEDRLKLIENRYWRQFSAMEKAVQRSNEQSAYLMQQFGGGM